MPRQIIDDWLTGALPHYAEPAACALKLGCVCVWSVMGRKEEEVKAWKEQMGYDAVQKSMMSDGGSGGRALCVGSASHDRYAQH